MPPLAPPADVSGAGGRPPEPPPGGSAALPGGPGGAPADATAPSGFRTVAAAVSQAADVIGSAFRKTVGKGFTAASATSGLAAGKGTKGPLSDKAVDAANITATGIGDMVQGTFASGQRLTQEAVSQYVPESARPTVGVFSQIVGAGAGIASAFAPPIVSDALRAVGGSALGAMTAAPPPTAVPTGVQTALHMTANALSAVGDIAGIFCPVVGIVTGGLSAGLRAAAGAPEDASAGVNLRVVRALESTSLELRRINPAINPFAAVAGFGTSLATGLVTEFGAASARDASISRNVVSDVLGTVAATKIPVLAGVAKVLSGLTRGFFMMFAPRELLEERAAAAAAADAAAAAAAAAAAVAPPPSVSAPR